MGPVAGQADHESRPSKSLNSIYSDRRPDPTSSDFLAVFSLLARPFVFLSVFLLVCQGFKDSQGEKSLEFSRRSRKTRTSKVFQTRKSEKVFVSQKRVSGFPEKRLTSGKSGELPGKSGELPGSLGNFRGTSGLLLGSTVRELPGKSPKTSGEVRGTSGEVWGLPGKLGEPDSLPVTRQICLQEKAPKISKPCPSCPWLFDKA